MSAAQLLNELHALGVELTVVDSKVRFRPAAVVTPELRTHLRQHKAAVIALLSAGAQSHAAREIARFEAVAVQTSEGGWIDPQAAKDPRIQRVLAASRAWRARPPDPEHDLPPPLHLPAGWKPKSWRGRLRQMAGSCQRCHPERAAQLRAWAQGCEYTVLAEIPPSEIGMEALIVNTDVERMLR